jgi:dehydrogenase/reductase SDR family protein 1
METALVAGASRGIGRGVAISLAASGFRVFATGRRIAEADLPAAVVRIPCDHSQDEQTDAAFGRIQNEAGHLDLLVNCAWGGYERMAENGAYTWPLPFWQQPDHRWNSMMGTGVRAAYICSARAARMMVPRGQGLIVNISSWAGKKHMGNVVYGVSKAATDRLTADTAQELRPQGVSVVSLYPGLVRTELVMAAAAGGWLDVTNSESPEFIGLVAAALARDPAVLQRSGEVLIAATVAMEYGVRDVDGKQPAPLKLENL